MTNKKNDHTTASASVDAWRARKDALTAATTLASQAAAAEQQGGGSQMDVGARVRTLSTRIARGEAEHEVQLSERAAAIALDASDRAEGNVHALACDPARLHAGLGEAQAEIERLERELAEARKRPWALMTIAQASWTTWAKERSASSLPRPIRFPGCGSVDAFTTMPTKEIVAGLARLLREGPAIPQEDSRLPVLRSEEAELRASRELALRKEDEKRKQEQALEQQRKFEEERSKKERQATADATRAESEKRAKERRDLIEADRAREAAAT